MTQINGLNFADLNLPIPNLVELILQSHELLTMPPPPLHRSLPPDRSTEENSGSDSETEKYPNSNRTSHHTPNSREQGSSRPKQSSVDNEGNDQTDSYTNILQNTNDSAEHSQYKEQNQKDKKSYEEVQTNHSALTRYLKLYGHEIPVYLTNGNTDEEVSSIHRGSPAKKDDTLHSTHKLSENSVHPVYTSEEDVFTSDLITKYFNEKNDKMNSTRIQAETDKVVRLNQTHILIKDIENLHDLNITEATPSNSAEEVTTSLPETTSVEDTEDETNLSTTTKLVETTLYNTAASLTDTPSLQRTMIENDKYKVENMTKTKVNSNSMVYMTSTEDDISVNNTGTTPTVLPTKTYISIQRDYISRDHRVPTRGELIPSSEKDTTPIAKDETLDTKSRNQTRITNSIYRPAHYTTSELTSTPSDDERIETTSLQYTPDDVTSTGAPAASGGPNIITDAVEISSRPLYTTVNEYTLTDASTEMSTLVPSSAILDSTTESSETSVLLQNTTNRSSVLYSSIDLPTQDTTTDSSVASISPHISSLATDISTDAPKTSSFLQNITTVSSSLRTATTLHKEYKSTNTPGTWSSESHMTTNAPQTSPPVQNANATTYVTNDNMTALRPHSPHSITAATVTPSLVRNVTGFVTMSSPRPLRNTTNIKRKGNYVMFC